MLKVPPRTVSLAAEEAFKAVNRHVRYVELDSHGYGVFDIARDGTQMDWYYVDNVTDPQSNAHYATSYRLPADAGSRVAPSFSPLDPNSYRPGVNQ
jgi:alkaline phosphatase D